MASRADLDGPQVVLTFAGHAEVAALDRLLLWCAASPDLDEDERALVDALLPVVPGPGPHDYA